MSLTLDGTDIMNPRSFRATPFRIEKRDRTANGTMAVDVQAVKHRFYIGYYQLDGSELAAWKALYAASDSMVFTYPENEVTQTVTVWFVDFMKDLVLLNPEVWMNVTIVMEEI